MNELDFACAQFRELLEEQLARIENMNTEKVDFSKKETVTVGIIDGDGIGPIIMAQAVRVLEYLNDNTPPEVESVFVRISY